MLTLTYFIHGNLQYAEFDESKVPAIVKRSYLPALEYFASHREHRAVFEFSGVSLEFLAENWPRTIDLLRLMLQRGQIELLGSTFANPILPLIPTDHARRQLAVFQSIYSRLFGDLQKPAGIYLQEFAYSPALAPLIRAAGYSYTILTPELMLSGLRHQFNSALKSQSYHPPSVKSMARLELLHPLTVLGANQAELVAVSLQRDLIEVIFDYSNGKTSFEEVAALLAALDGAHCRETPGLLLFGPSDAEFIGFYDFMNHKAINIEKLGDLMERTAELPFVELGLPREYLREHPPSRKVYLPAGTSEPAFDIWTKDPDNDRLNALCAEAGVKLQLAEMALGWRPDAPRNLLERAWRAMLLSENSDGRGWHPCPERRLFCYDQALLAIELADKILKMANSGGAIL